MAAEHEIQPYEALRIPGTALAVYHQGDEESWAHVQDDGAVKLFGPADWWVRVEPTPTDLGEVTKTVTEYAEQRIYASGRTEVADYIMHDEDTAEAEVEGSRHQIASLPPGFRADQDPLADASLVTRTRTDYTSGHTLYSPWRVTG
jgi:hypothetical protein